MKKTASVISILLWFATAGCQSVNEDVSIISVEMDSTICEKQSSEKINMFRLRITYENKTDYAIYFAKVANECRDVNNIGIPRFLPAGLMNPPKTNISNIDYSNDTLIIQIGCGDRGYWEILDKNVQLGEEYEVHPLNDDFYIYYDTLNHFPFNRHKDLLNDIVAKRIDSLTRYDDYFVFLKPGEKHSDFFDISGFSLFKGHYYFVISDDKSNGFIIDNKYDEKLKKWYQITEPYPDSIGEYKLYTGLIESNILSVDF